MTTTEILERAYNLVDSSQKELEVLKKVTEHFRTKRMLTREEFLALYLVVRNE